MPTGYQAKTAVTDQTVTENNLTVTVEVEQIPLKATIKYVLANGNVVETVTCDTTEVDLLVPASAITASMPQGYKAVNQVTDQKITKDNPVVEVQVDLIEVQWTATVKYVDANQSELVTHTFNLTNKNPEISAADIEQYIPNGYVAKNTVNAWTVTQDNDELVVECKEKEWTATIQYVAAGNPVGNLPVTKTGANPQISVEEIENGMPADYMKDQEITALDITQDNQTFTVQVKAVETWTATVKFMTADGTEAGSYNFTVTNKNPNILAADIEKLVPQGYVATAPITDQTVTQNNEVITIQIGPEEMQWTVTINFISNARATIGSASFQVTNLNPVVTAAQIKGAIPTGYEAAETIGDITATQDGQTFDIQVQPGTWTITIDFKDEAGNSVGAASLMISAINPVISVEELNSMLPAGYKLLLDNPVTVLADSIANGVGTIIVPIVPASAGSTNPTGGPSGQGVENNVGVKTSTQTMAGLYAMLGLGALAAGPSIYVKKRKKK